MRMAGVVFALPVLPALLAVSAAGGERGAAGEAGIVASVYDGDTLTLTNGRRVRLLQIDTPELGSGECYSRAARAALVSLAPPGSRIALEPDATLDKVDRYGRLLRYVVRGGTNVNLELVRRGAAAPYFYRGERGRHAAALLRAVGQARAGRRGLWKACPATGSAASSQPTAVNSATASRSCRAASAAAARSSSATALLSSSSSALKRVRSTALRVC